MLSKYYFQRCNTRYFQKRFKDAGIDYSKAIETNPQLAKAWYNKGTALKALGRTIEADAAFTKTKELGSEG